MITLTSHQILIVAQYLEGNTCLRLLQTCRLFRFLKNEQLWQVKVQEEFRARVVTKEVLYQPSALGRFSSWLSMFVFTQQTLMCRTTSLDKETYKYRSETHSVSCTGIIPWCIRGAMIFDSQIEGYELSSDKNSLVQCFNRNYLLKDRVQDRPKLYSYLLRSHADHYHHNISILNPKNFRFSFAMPLNSNELVDGITIPRPFWDDNAEDISDSEEEGEFDDLYPEVELKKALLYNYTTGNERRKRYSYLAIVDEEQKLYILRQSNEKFCYAPCYPLPVSLPDSFTKDQTIRSLAWEREKNSMTLHIIDGAGKHFYARCHTSGRWLMMELNSGWQTVLNVHYRFVFITREGYFGECREYGDRFISNKIKFIYLSLGRGQMIQDQEGCITDFYNWVTKDDISSQHPSLYLVPPK